LLLEHLIADAHLRGFGGGRVVALAGAPEPPHPLGAFPGGVRKQDSRGGFFVESETFDKDTVSERLDRGDGERNKQPDSVRTNNRETPMTS